jgi:hypothetical protein
MIKSVITVINLQNFLNSLHSLDNNTEHKNQYDEEELRIECQPMEFRYRD